MKQRKLICILFSSMGLLALILDGRTALTGAAEGIDLCIRRVIPSLFPFLFLCSILTEALWGGNLVILQPIGRIIGIPWGGESLLIAGFLGGYPAGAQAIADAYRTGRLAKQDSEHLLTCCSNAGPAFLFGMIASQFPDRGTVWALWAIQILSALITGLRTDKRSEQPCVLTPKSGSVSQILTRTVKTMGLICGWILLFRILFAFLLRWALWYFPAEIQVMITGLLELSNGCCALSAVENEELRFLICSGMLSFGGLCVAMQTASVIGELSIKPYLQGKAAQTGISLLLSAAYLELGSMILWILGGVLLLFPKKRKKRWISAASGCIMPVSPPGGKNHAVS